MSRFMRAALCTIVTIMFALLMCACGVSTPSSTSSAVQQGFSPASISDRTVQPQDAQMATSEAALPSEVAERQNVYSERMYAEGIVCIDAGHQASDDLAKEPIGPGSSTTKYRNTRGATSVTTGIGEYVVTLDVALKLRDELEARGVTVVMTRTENDVNLSNIERAQIANDAGANLVIHLHCDGFDEPTPTGFSTLVPARNEWTSPIYDESVRAGRIIQDTAVADLNCVDRGVVERSDLTGLNWSTVPAVFVEMGFMTTPDEDALLVTDEYQEQLAKALADGTVLYLRSL